MARPPEYAPRVDTKVRLRADHAALLRTEGEKRTLGRNRLIEMALDQFFGITPTGPRLKTADPAAPLAQGGPRKPSRVTPRIGKASDALEAQSEARTPRRTP